LVFGWSLFGTVFFVVLRVLLSLAAGRQPPALFEKVVEATMDLAKIGFGAVVGLLGGSIRRSRRSARMRLQSSSFSSLGGSRWLVGDPEHCHPCRAGVP